MPSLVLLAGPATPPPTAAPTCLKRLRRLTRPNHPILPISAAAPEAGSCA
jgi:hypothetical protein